MLAFSSEKRQLRTGERLFSAGDLSDGAFVVLEGEIALTSGATERRAGAGALIGESALLTETRRPADASAAGEALVLRIPRATFRRVLEEFPAGAAEIRAAALRRTGALVSALARLERRFS